MTCTTVPSKKLASFCKENFLGQRIPLDCGIELTSACNLNCVHCYIDRASHITSLGKKYIFKIIDQAFDLGCINITFTGGELLCREDFLEIYKYTRLKGIAVIVFSNATLLTQHHIDYFIEYPLLYFSATMYGVTKEVYENVTQTPGSYDKFLHGISLLNKNDIKFEIKSVALTINKHEILDIGEFAKQLYVPFRYSTFIRAKNNFCTTNLKYRLSPQDAFWFDINDPARLSFWQKEALDPKPQPFSEMRRRNKHKYICHAGEQSLWIQSDLTLRICSKEVSSGFDLCTGTLSEGWTEFIRQQANTRFNDKKYMCLTCDFFRYCEQCTADIASEDIFDILPNAFQCVLAKLRHDWCQAYRQNYNKLNC